LTTTKKRVQDQLELMLTHKEHMKDKEIEREHIHFDKAKDVNYTKLLVEEQILLSNYFGFWANVAK
jgi:hypothetical protein